MSKKRVCISVYVSPDFYEVIKDDAEDKDRTMAANLLRIIKQHYKDKA